MAAKMLAEQQPQQRHCPPAALPSRYSAARYPAATAPSWHVQHQGVNQLRQPTHPGRHPYVYTLHKPLIFVIPAPPPDISNTHPYTPSLHRIATPLASRTQAPGHAHLDVEASFRKFSTPPAICDNFSESSSFCCFFSASCLGLSSGGYTCVLVEPRGLITHSTAPRPATSLAHRTRRVHEWHHIERGGAEKEQIARAPKITAH